MEDSQSEERPNYYSFKLFIKYSINKNSLNYNNRTTRAVNKSHSFNTLQTSRFVLVRPLDNLVRRSYVNQVIQRVEIVNWNNSSLNPDNNSSDLLSLSSLLSNNNDSNSDILFELSNTDLSNSEATKRYKKHVKKK